MAGAPEDFVLAVDIGGGSVKLALTNSAADDVRSSLVDNVAAYNGDALLNEIGRHALSMREMVQRQGGHIIGAAIGVPGFVSSDGRASSNSNVPALDGIDLVDYFGARLGCSIKLENDANLAAMGEWAFGPSKSASRFLMVTLGTGIGVALLDRGTPVNIVAGTLGDAGHVIVDGTGARSCRLGCRGCLESVASGVALIEIAQELGDQLPQSGLGDLRRKRTLIGGAEIAGLAAMGDEVVLSMLSHLGYWLGLGLASYVNLFAPDVIHIGGGLSQLRRYLEASTIEAMNRSRIKNRVGPQTVLFSSAFDRAAARGAAAMFFSKSGHAHAE